MPGNGCASCGTQFLGPAPATCPRCHKPTAGAAPAGGGAMSLDLKESANCANCDYETYEENLQDGKCPRCHEPFHAEEGEDEKPRRGKSGRLKRGAPKPRGAHESAGGSRPKRDAQDSSSGSRHKLDNEKKQVVLTEAFKTQVFNAFRAGDARGAQQLCFEMAEEREEHARQIYTHLLGVAKKKGWLPAPGTKLPPLPVPGAAPSTASPPPSGSIAREPALPIEFDPSPEEGVGSSEALALPIGFLAPGPSAPLPIGDGGLRPLPAPPGFAPPAPAAQAPVSLAPPPGFAAGASPLPAPPGFNAAASWAPPPQPPPPPPPAPSSPPTDPMGRGRGSPSDSNSRGRGTPQRSARPGEPPDPEERGFLARVAVEGRAAQVSLLCQAQRFAAARDLAQATLAREPYLPRGHCALGQALAGLGQDAQALQAYTNAVRADPNDPVAIRGYAQILVRMNRLPEAINAYRRLVGPGKGALEDVVALAGVLRKAGDVEGGKRVLEEVAKRDPQNLESMRQEAEARAAAGELSQAAGILEQVLLKEKPPHPMGLAMAESLVGKASQSPQLILACARTFAAARRPLAAVRLLVPLLQRMPGNIDARRALGLAYARLGAGPLAEEQLLQVVNQRAAGADEFLALGEVYLERGDVAAGGRALLRARDARPDDAEVRRALARALVLQGDLDGAMRELRAVHQSALRSETAPSARGRGDQSALEDELDRLAERAFTKRLREIEARLLQDPESAEARLELARAHAQRGDLREALAHFARAGKDPAARGKSIEVGEALLEEAEGGERREVVVVLARILLENDDAPRAAGILEEQVVATPDDAELLLLLYEAWAASQRVQEAVVGLAALLPAAPSAHLGAAIALAERFMANHGYNALALPVARAQRRQGQVEEAARGYARYLEGEADDPEVRREYAQLLEGAGKIAEAFAVMGPLVQGTQGSVGDLERVAALALSAGNLEEAVALLQRACDRVPEDLALKRSLETAEAKLREERIAALADATSPEDRMKLAALHAEAGRKAEAIEVLRALGRVSENPDQDYLRFCGEHFARTNKIARAEEAMRQVARSLGYAPGSDQAKALLYRLAGLYERASDRRSARRVYLELSQQDARYKDVEARLDALQDEVAAGQGGKVDERTVELVDVGAPQGTIFDALMSQDLAIDPKLLAQH